jgi:hypothetical protein
VRFLALPLVLAAVPLAACVNTDQAVFVTPTMTAAAATVTVTNVGGVPFAATVTGSFTLDLHLGARAAGPSTVSMVEFSIEDAHAMADIVSPLSVTGDMTFPLTVQPDSDSIIHFTFDTGGKTLPPSDGDMTHLCAPAGVQIKGVFNDSLAAPQTPVYSGPFMPTCM